MTPHFSNKAKIDSRNDKLHFRSYQKICLRVSLFIFKIYWLTEDAKWFFSLTLHVPASPNYVVQSDLVLPSKSDAFEAIPFRRCQLLSGTNPNAHTSPTVVIKFKSHLINMEDKFLCVHVRSLLFIIIFCYDIKYNKRRSHTVFHEIISLLYTGWDTWISWKESISKRKVSESCLKRDK